MPSVIDGGRPAPASSGASFDSVSGSFATTDRNEAAVEHAFDRREALLDGTARRPGDQLHVVLGNPAAHRHVVAATT
jgi:hypothetical protein